VERRGRELVRRIRLITRRRLNTYFSGEYHSAFRGQGLLFDSVREYQYGDDVRSIDWNVSARMNHLFVRQYIEERELSVVLAVDLSASGLFGSSREKSEALLEAAGLLLYLARMNNDRVSVLLFTDRIEKYMAAGKGRTFVSAVLDEIIGFVPEGRGTDIYGALDFLGRVLKKRSVIFVLSDFLDEGYETRLRHLNRRHDVIPVVVSDPLERAMPLYGLTEFEDMETGERFLTEAVPGMTGGPADPGIGRIDISTDEPLEKPFIRFFEQRNRAYRSGGARR